jgi:hypothetical protein
VRDVQRARLPLPELAAPHRAAADEARVRRQRGGPLERVALGDRLARVLREPGQRVQRQAEAHRRVAGDEVHAIGAEGPRAASPAPAVRGGQRQRPAHHVVEPGLKDAREARAFARVVEARVERVDVGREPPLTPEVVPDVLVGLEREAAVDAEAPREPR